MRVPRLKWIQNENKYEIIEQKRNDEVEVWPIDPKGEKEYGELILRVQNRELKMVKLG